ncbi:MAG: ATP-binding cassette domain-containing protein, partial [Myxococcaceae bacterium]|nr:ATP-binding cassette domain-containing protein [Myxococcaceae bacterium]
MTFLAVEHLSVRHRRAVTDAVRDVSLEVAPGEVLGVVGESGSGKSTLLKAWLSLLPARSGLVLWQGRPLTSASLRAFRRVVQPVFQDPRAALDPRLAVREALAEPFQVHREPFSEATLARLLDEVQLPAELLPRRP